MTINDVRTMVKSVNVNKYGYTPFNHGYRLQIYSHKNQVNINSCESDSDYGWSCLNVVFDDDEKVARMYRAKKGICDYDNSVEYNYDTHIDDTLLRKYDYLFVY